MAPRIAICMGTHNPDPALFRAQLDSIRGQTHPEWRCAISDDASDAGSYAEIEDAVRSDERFSLSRSERRLGFYRNFERALAAAPGAPYVALADHDDRWYPDKLETLLSALTDAGAELAYSDARPVDRNGREVRPTMWGPGERPNQWTSLSTLLIANTVTGAASLMRREVAEAALPFPDLPGKPYHDHWLAAVALARGDLVHVDRPLYDWVRHPGSVIVSESEGLRPADSGRLRPLRGGWEDDERDHLRRLERMCRVLEERTADRASGRKLREMRRVGSADSLGGLLWLSRRWLRSRFRRSAGLGRELLLLRGVLWRRTRRIRGASRSR